MPLAGLEPTIPATNRPRPTPRTARPLWPTEDTYTCRESNPSHLHGNQSLYWRISWPNQLITIWISANSWLLLKLNIWCSLKHDIINIKLINSNRYFCMRSWHVSPPPANSVTFLTCRPNKSPLSFVPLLRASFCRNPFSFFYFSLQSYLFNMSQNIDSLCRKEPLLSIHFYWYWSAPFHLL
jgi:hypothetical protein